MTERRHQIPDIASAARIKAGRRFVEEKHPRWDDQRDRDVDTSAHSAGIGGHSPVGGMRHVEPLDQFIGPPSRMPVPQPAQLTEEHQILTAGEEFVERGVLPRHTDARADLGRLSLDVESRDSCRPRGRAQQGGQDVDRRGLPGAVVAE